MEHRTVILAAGDFPKRGGEAWRILVAAKRVVACDGAADAYRRHFRKWPSVIVGDMDSLRSSVVKPRTPSLQSPDIVHFTDQDTNDLEKAIVCCAMKGWKTPVIVGATGKREDHALGNVFRAFDCGCEIVTDTGRFVPFCGKAAFKVRKGASVSVFAPDPRTRMTSQGLAWALDGVKFRNLYCATLNRATSARIVVRSDRPAFVYLEK